MFEEKGTHLMSSMLPLHFLFNVLHAQWQPCYSKFSPCLLAHGLLLVIGAFFVALLQQAKTLKFMLSSTESIEHINKQTKGPCLHECSVVQTCLICLYVTSDAYRQPLSILEDSISPRTGSVQGWAYYPVLRIFKQSQDG